MLILAVVAFSWGDLLFGIDTGSFGALQVLPSWFRDFGQYDAATDTYSSPIERRSLMNSIVLYVCISSQRVVAALHSDMLTRV